MTLLKQVVMIQEQTLPEDHPNRLVSQQVLATLFWDLDQSSVAIQIMQKVVRIEERVLSEQHPDREIAEEWLRYMEDETTISS